MLVSPRRNVGVSLAVAALALTACKAKAPAPAKPAPAAANPAPQKASAGEKHVKVSVTPLDSDQDGLWDLLAIEWVITPGWHIYWTNPGDSGLETKVQFTGSSKDAFSAVKLPAPSRFESPGGIVGYGYADHTAFFASRVHPQTPMPKISATLSWLVCKDTCLRGKTTLERPLPDKAFAMSPKLQHALDRLPRSASKLPATQQWTTQSNGHRTLEVNAISGELLEFFPLQTGVDPSEIELSKSKLTITYPSLPNTAKHETPQGIVGLRDQGQTRYYELIAPLPSR